MEVKIQVPEYSLSTGLKSHWEEGFEVKVVDTEDTITISANKAGLLSLAVQLLTLAQDTVPAGCHYHYDDCNSLKAGSKEFVIQKFETGSKEKPEQ
jgi:hypothetical protein